MKIVNELFGGIIKTSVGYATVDIKELMFNKDAYKYTDEELAEIEIRTDARNKLRESEIKSDINVDQFNDESKDIDDQKLNDPIYNNDHDNDTLGDDDEKASLLNDNDTKDESDTDGVKKIKGVDYCEYHLLQKNAYDLTEILPEFMKTRRIYDNELEECIKIRPFIQIPFFSTRKKPVGYFKGLISFTNDKKNAAQMSDNPYLKGILGKNEDLFLRLYVLDGVLSYADDDCDPYLVVKIGKHKFDTRSDHLIKTKDVDFYKGFELPIKLPGPSKLIIEVWDYDGIGDDFIGSTTIDIEDRYFSPNWRDYGTLIDTKKPDKPVEERTFGHQKVMYHKEN
eukprot:CAMPEP_0114659606 /NCGR_PEP_ID=MMETSP0191-20121206/18200_1 /TAXON_ID=126664 /ORGANISM="Sorites sp." /LENGTH=338 /DNA_ID=CAMNT_0001885365 /DNA_START=520 /DNA_END=1537 /DNA_ORIENTATION=+